MTSFPAVAIHPGGILRNGKKLAWVWVSLWCGISSRVWDYFLICARFPRFGFFFEPSESVGVTPGCLTEPLQGQKSHPEIGRKSSIPFGNFHTTVLGLFMKTLKSPKTVVFDFAIPKRGAHAAPRPKVQGTPLAGCLGSGCAPYWLAWFGVFFWESASKGAGRI